MSTVAVKDVMTGEDMFSVMDANGEEVAAAYRRAWRAFDEVRQMPVRGRLAELGKLKKYIRENKEWLVSRICEETGKSRTDALLTEIFPSLDLIAFYEKTAEKTLRDQWTPTAVIFFPKRSRIYFEPMGPVLVIAPWNYPFMLGFQPVISAFVAGNSVILKPSEYTPLHGVYEKMMRESGFMAGPGYRADAIQVVYGGRETGRSLIDGGPRKILFTGSVAAGKKVMAQAAEHLIPVDLELGGKDPMIVFDDVNIERTVNGALWGGFVNSGQTCTSIDRIYVQEGIYERFVAALKEKAERITTRTGLNGNFDEGDLEMGSMTTDFQVEKVQEELADARKRGATILTGGAFDEQLRQFSPTIVTDVDTSMRLQRDETFGPVVTVTKFRTEAEAVRMANDTPYGLMASVWSADIRRAQRVAHALEAGSVSINNALATHANSGLPFGGVKQSGFGRYRGEHGLLAFCNVKSVVIDWQSPRIELNWYPYGKEKYALLGRMIDHFFSGKRFSFLRTLMIGLQLERLSWRKRL